MFASINREIPDNLQDFCDFESLKQLLQIKQTQDGLDTMNENQQEICNIISQIEQYNNIVPVDQRMDIEEIKKNMGFTDDLQLTQQDSSFRQIVDLILGKVNLNLEKLNEFPQEVQTSILEKLSKEDKTILGQALVHIEEEEQRIIVG